jgi:hypothetical protein
MNDYCNSLHNVTHAFVCHLVAEVWRTKTRLICACCMVGSSCTSNVSQDGDSHLKVAVQSTPVSSYIELCLFKLMWLHSVLFNFCTIFDIFYIIRFVGPGN